MLGKIVKYELKATRFFFLLMLGFIAATTLIVVFIGILPTALEARKAQEYYDYYGSGGMEMASIGIMISILLYSLVMMAVSAGSQIAIGVRFYKTMYGHQGYLTQSLPVKPHELLLGKTIAAVLWLLLIGIVYLLSIALLGSVAGFAVMQATVLDFYKLSGYMNGWLHDTFGNNYYMLILIGLVSVVCNTIYSVLMIFFSISLGQRANSHRGLVSVAIYLGLSILIAIGNSVFTQVITFSAYSHGRMHMGGPSLLMYAILIFGLSVSVLASVLFYLGTHWTLEKRLNLQ